MPGDSTSTTSSTASTTLSSISERLSGKIPQLPQIPAPALGPATKKLLSSANVIEGGRVLGDRIALSALIISCNVCGLIAAKGTAARM